MTAQTTTLYVTFGVQYPREPHPILPEADGNGYLRVVARGLLSREAMRASVFLWLGARWSFDYDEVPEAEFFPRGELGALDADRGLFVAANGGVRRLRRADGQRGAGHFGDCPTPEILIPLNCTHCQSFAPYPATSPPPPEAVEA